MANTCLLRVEALLKKSSIESVQRDEIINQIKAAQAELKLSKVDEINVDAVSQEVIAQLKLQRKINKRNAIENELKGRELVDFVFKEFPDDPQEGLIAILVGSNDQRKGARASVAVQQHAAINQLIVGFSKRLKDANVEALFADADKNTQLRIARTMFELNQKPTEAERATGIEPVVTERNPEIIKLATIMEEYSELIRTKLNDRGANIGKLWGYVVRQSHDPFLVRDAAKRLGVDPTPKTKLTKTAEIEFDKNFQAWKDFAMSKLDYDRTFANVDEKDIPEFMRFVYNSLVYNDNAKSNGVEFAYGAKPIKNAAKSAEMKRVLHFKNADDWFDYNEQFGVGNLNESFFSGLTTAGRNIGIIDVLGTRPTANFESVRNAIQRRLIKEGKDPSKVEAEQYIKFMKVVDGSIYSVKDFALAKYSAITRAIQSMAKLGGAVISAAADIAQYGGEMSYQGKSFLGGMYEAMSSLGRLKNTKDKQDIAQGLGFITDNSVYELAGKFVVGDNLSKGWTNAQRTFFKYNLLSWWTNTLKEGSMLGMANYFAKQKGLQFDELNSSLQTLFKQYNIDSTQWNVIRSVAMEKAEDGTEFINIAKLDQITDSQARLISGYDNLSQREIGIVKDKFKMSVSGMLLDRSIYAVIEPDARVKGVMLQGTMAGTGMGEAIRFIGQFKAFPMSIIQKTISRELSFVKAGNTSRAVSGLASIFVASSLLGYVSMTAKDLLKGRTPRKPGTKTFLAALMQGGGLGLYGDVLFQETRQGADILSQLAGPTLTTGFDVLQALKYVVTPGKQDLAARNAYRTVSQNIPFLNLFYVKTAFDYLIGYQMMETMNPGVLKRVEKRMKEDYDQEFIFTKPSQNNRGF